MSQAERENQGSGRQELDRKGRREKIEEQRWEDGIYGHRAKRRGSLVSSFPWAIGGLLYSGEPSNETHTTLLKEYTGEEDYCRAHRSMNHPCQDLGTFPIILQCKPLYNTAFNIPPA